MNENKKRKKEKRVLGDHGEGVSGNSLPVLVENTTVEKKKKKKATKLVEGKLQLTEEESSKDTQDISTEIKGEKKKKRKKDTLAEENGDTKLNDSQEPQKKKKRKNHDLPYPDPENDTVLTNQACKALSYAYAQFQDPPNWKFNKARQNWLVRNAWSSEAIPENYVPLLVQYLAGVKGGVKENLVKTCQSILSPPEPQQSTPELSLPVGDPSATEPPKTQDVEDVKIDTVKESRARTLLNVLSVST
ncbi:hypothetical protein SERLA73DRAFT_49264 [Serpula lacrymans var. lacrymans S7.3]|uniref:WKF domain-containing protein n=1 Tax=Serpula lacrymans var. lacrymans (strain S7.3) TaxID=936435 RepID=F8PR13_SERL3|nr:hypothetical protein SERLA73DRAFT_49264 [Serpula lacrymans var. lacrymans S7.3]